ncbi:hypothetical protein [Bacillus salipaludis]|uniref:hypothetical protein n=1 Tax=Bacillus salipaludis TaxID=2547811 RepID=UPI002E1FC461|nr:hypothetical protein [Bacillus salipaludis]
MLLTKLDYIKANCEDVIKRFYKACIGWTLYKPLWLDITDLKGYEERIQEMREQLAATLPKMSEYFGRNDFMKIATELENYHRNVKKHYNDFIETQKAWENIFHAYSIRGSFPQWSKALHQWGNDPDFFCRLCQVRWTSKGTPEQCERNKCIS